MESEYRIISLELNAVVFPTLPRKNSSMLSLTCNKNLRDNAKKSTGKSLRMRFFRNFINPNVPVAPASVIDLQRTYPLNTKKKSTAVHPKLAKTFEPLKK